MAIELPTLTPLILSPHWTAPAHGTTEIPAVIPKRRSLQSRVVRLDNATHHGGVRVGPALYLIFHDTEGESALSSIHYLNTTTEKVASYHYVIERNGTIYRMVDSSSVAWHAGDSAWPSPAYFPPGNGGSSLNRVSIGIAWANRGNGEPLTPQQLESGLWLTTVFPGVPLERIRGHYEVSPGRKFDPAKTMNMDDWRAMVARYRLGA
jgi:N-acetylmuramoyl-L-alanine amidase